MPAVVVAAVYIEPFALAARPPEEKEVMARDVVVACEVVELSPVKFCKVDEPVARMFAEVSNELTKELVDESVVEKKLVEVP